MQTQHDSLQGNGKPLARAFKYLNTVQFFGALNDNILKLLIIFFLISRNGGTDAGIIAAQAGAVFVLPFLLFSAAAGVVADRFSKQRIIIVVKLAEVAVTLLAVGAFFAGSAAGLYLVLFLMASHSALFAPAKYGIVPELVQREQLSRANGLLEMTTYLAIIAGTALAPVLCQVSSFHYGLASVACIYIALSGLFVGTRLAPTPAAGSTQRVSWFFLRDIGNTLRGVSQDGYLLLAVCGAAYFMLLGAFVQINLIPYGMQKLGLSQEQGGYLFLVAALGIGAGSYLAGRLSGRNVEFGVVPIGAIGLTLATACLHYVSATVSLVIPLILLLGVSAGLFIVPLQSFIQLRAPHERLGEILAAAGFLSWLGVLAASGITWLFTAQLGLNAGQGFLLIAGLTCGLTIITLVVLPDFLLRFIGLLVMKFCYRIRVIGNDHLPLEGPALLVANHVSWVDALLLMATQQRRIRFIMEREIYQTPLLKPLFRLMGVIPVSGRDSRHQLVEFVREARQVLDDGYMLCIFAEGAITRSGMLREFKPGFERIMKDSDYPIIPVYIGGAWGSILSYAHGRLLSKWPAMFPYPVTILFGKPLPAASKAVEVKQAVMELSAAWFESRKPRRRSLQEEFVRTARQNWRQHAISDTTGKRLSYGQLLTGAIALADKIGERTAGQDKVGILLPPSAGGCMVNLAIACLGKVPVNLNYTASAEGLGSAIDQCGIQCVVSSRTFLEKLGSEPSVRSTVCIEDLLTGLSAGDKRRAWLKARFLPRRLLLGKIGLPADALATIIFSSGSVGEPKGVMLSHHNILSNLEALRMVFRVTPQDNICSALPFFHSLGFTGTLWLPLLSGFSAAYHVNPLDGGKIAEMVRERRSTLLIATPTFLLAYLRRAKAEDFKTLRLIMTGAEKLQPRVADAFEEKFGIRPLEGYGATELSPVISLSLPEVKIDGVRQIGAKTGSVGHPVPGVAIRVIDPETGTVLPAGTSGLITVKGPNVMLGYLHRPDLTGEAILDGWYLTGDIGFLDEDCFLHITDRLSRFSKIGGEMVPHGVIEEELQRGLHQTAQLLAVTAVPDEKKGERLVVLFTKEAGDGETLHKMLAESALPNLWKPNRDCYIEVEALPLLGSGKLDLKELRQMAQAAKRA